MTKYGVCAKFVTKLRKDGEELLREAGEQQLSLHTKSVRKAAYPEFEKKVFTFCEIARSLNLPVTQCLIR